MPCSVPIVLVGNKSDLHNERQVSVEKGKKLAEEMKAFFLETSAKENQVRALSVWFKFRKRVGFRLFFNKIIKTREN